MSTELTNAASAVAQAFPSSPDCVTLSSSATSDADYPSSNGLLMGAGRYALNVTGTLDGATVQLYSKPAGHASFFAVDNTSLTAAGSVSAIYIGKGDTVKAVLSGAGASTDLLITLNREQI